jgi:hypothetical protein
MCFKPQVYSCGSRCKKMTLKPNHRPILQVSASNSSPTLSPIVLQEIEMIAAAQLFQNLNSPHAAKGKLTLTRHHNRPPLPPKINRPSSTASGRPSHIRAARLTGRTCQRASLGERVVAFLRSSNHPVTPRPGPVRSGGISMCQWAGRKPPRPEIQSGRAMKNTITHCTWRMF